MVIRVVRVAALGVILAASACQGKGNLLCGENEERPGACNENLNVQSASATAGTATIPFGFPLIDVAGTYSVDGRLKNVSCQPQSFLPDEVIDLQIKKASIAITQTGSALSIEKEVCQGQKVVSKTQDGSLSIYGDFNVSSSATCEAGDALAQLQIVESVSGRFQEQEALRFSGTVTLTYKVQSGAETIVSCSVEYQADGTRKVQDTTALATGDTVPPAFIGLKSGTVVSTSQVELTWSEAKDDQTTASGIEYEICRSALPAACTVLFVPNFAPPPGSTRFTVSGLQPATAYYFVVRAKDESGNREYNSSEITLTTQTPGSLLFKKGGQAANDGLGSEVAGKGDVNADGRPDILAGAPWADAGGLVNSGSVFVFSGVDGSVLLQKNGEGAGDSLGADVSFVGDIDSDGKADFIAGSPDASRGGIIGSGSAQVFSGADGAILFKVNGSAVNEELGSSVAGGGDLNGDGIPDFAVGAINSGSKQSGAVFAFSGSNGSLLFQKTGETASEAFGCEVAFLGDVDGDGKDDLGVGACQADPANLIGAGSAFVYSGADGRLLFRKDGGSSGDTLGTAMAGGGDLNGDGRTDFIIGIPFASPGGQSLAGSAYVYSGMDGSLLVQKNGSSTTDELGMSVSFVGDLNGDARSEWMVGAPGIGSGGRGAVYVYSGIDGKQLYKKDGERSGDSFNQGDLFGWSVAAAGDVNGDGKPDFLIGAPNATSEGRTEAGNVYLYIGP